MLAQQQKQQIGYSQPKRQRLSETDDESIAVAAPDNISIDDGDEGEDEEDGGGVDEEDAISVAEGYTSSNNERHRSVSMDRSASSSATTVSVGSRNDEQSSTSEYSSASGTVAGSKVVHIFYK